MNKKFAVMIAFVALVALPVSAFAATYGYVSTNGTLATVTANSAAEALVAATNIDPHSGVILMTSGVMPMPVVTSMPMMPLMTTGTSPVMATSSMMTSTSTMATSTSMMASSTMMMSTSTSMMASSTMMMSATSTATSTSM